MPIRILRSILFDLNLRLGCDHTTVTHQNGPTTPGSLAEARRMDPRIVKALLLLEAVSIRLGLKSESRHRSAFGEAPGAPALSIAPRDRSRSRSPSFWTGHKLFSH